MIETHSMLSLFIMDSDSEDFVLNKVFYAEMLWLIIEWMDTCICKKNQINYNESEWVF